jgi:hypothetical protein
MLLCMLPYIQLTCGPQLLEEVEAQLRAAASSVQTLFNNAADRDMISNPSDGKHAVSIVEVLC